MEQKVGCARQGFLPRENLGELAQQSSPDQILTCGDVLKRAFRLLDQPAFSFLCLHLRLFARPHHVQVSSVVDGLGWDARQRAGRGLLPFFVRVASGLMLRYGSFLKAVKLQPCLRIGLLAGVTLGFCQEQKQAVAESAQSQSCQGYHGCSSRPPQAVVEITRSFFYNAQHRICTL